MVFSAFTSSASRWREAYVFLNFYDSKPVRTESYNSWVAESLKLELFDLNPELERHPWRSYDVTIHIVTSYDDE